MDILSFEGMMDMMYLISLGYIIAISVIITIAATQIIKKVLCKRGLLPSEEAINVLKDDNAKLTVNGAEMTKTHAKTYRDNLLSRIGTAVGWCAYCICYVVDLLIRKRGIAIDGALLVAINAGGLITWSLSKALYTRYKQRLKKRQAQSLVTAVNYEIEPIEEHKPETDDIKLINAANVLASVLKKPPELINKVIDNLKGKKG